LKDLTAQFQEIARALERLPDDGLILDGEVVAFDRHDVSWFQLLQRRALGERIRPVSRS
jgi:ATP-dependent DNA ligase